MPDGVVGVQPVLKARDFDVQKAYREWVEAGEPEPTADEIDAYEAEHRASDPMWVTGTEQIRPPPRR